MNIPAITDPIERFVAFIREREDIRLRRERGDPWPWTEDLTLQTYRFTNVRREHDKVSRHYQKTIRNHYGESPIVLPATVFYRWFNRPSTCDAFFNEPDLENQTTFERYIEANDPQILLDCLTEIEPPHVTGAFIITGKPGFSKGEGVIHWFHDWCQRPWNNAWKAWINYPPSLALMYEWLDGTGLGSFMRGQIVADLKYLPFMRHNVDWWAWATPGPGSQRGLNIVFGRPMDTTWGKGEWLFDLQRLSVWVEPELEKHGIGKLHNQDLQNCLCEFSKYTKVTTNVGRPRQVFRHV